MSCTLFKSNIIYEVPRLGLLFYIYSKVLERTSLNACSRGNGHPWFVFINDLGVSVPCHHFWAACVLGLWRLASHCHWARGVGGGGYAAFITSSIVLRFLNPSD